MQSSKITDSRAFSQSALLVGKHTTHLVARNLWMSNLFLMFLILQANTCFSYIITLEKQQKKVKD